MNRLKTMTDGAGKEESYEYNKESKMIGKKDRNGVEFSYQYDENDQFPVEKSGNLEYHYTYDALGNMLTTKDQTGTTVYTYDDLSCVTKKVFPTGDTVSYTYDKMNRMEKVAWNGQKAEYQYDANGNQTKVSEKNESTGKTAEDRYQYDTLNQLIHIDSRDGSRSDYTYYATGLRATKKVNNSTSVFIYDGKDILTETTPEGSRTNIYGNNMIATTGTDVLYYQYNNHGDVVGVLDQTGTLKNEYDYDAFGKYTDPLSLNKYTYCHNQPVTGYDPDGHALHIVAGAVIGGIIGGVMGGISAKKNGNSVLRGVLGGMAEGAIVGGVGAATGGLSLGYALGASAAASAVENTANQMISTGTVDGKKVLASTAAGIAGMGGAKLAGTALKTGSSAAVKAAGKIFGEAGNQAAAKAGGNVACKTLMAAAQGGITGAAAGASADAAMQCAEYGAGLRSGINGREIATSALFGGGIGTAFGAVSQTKPGQQIEQSAKAGTAKLNGKTAKFENAVEGGVNKFLSGSGTSRLFGKGGSDFYVTPGGTAIPKENYHSMSNVDVRKWYLSQETKIPDLIDTSQSLEKQAYQAFSLRNEYRTTARELMADRTMAESLYISDPNRTWEQMLSRQMNKGLTGDDIYRAIIESSRRSRSSVNKKLGLD